MTGSVSFPTPDEKTPAFPTPLAEGSSEKDKGMPPPYQRQQPPPQGFRIQGSSPGQMPDLKLLGPAPFKDLGGEPVYVASAIFGERGTSVHPGKFGPHLPDPCRVPFGGVEYQHTGRYDLLILTPDMEWVMTSHGKIPHGRRPIDGGFEEDGRRLYHAAVTLDGVDIPGKTGEHLGGAHVAWAGAEKCVKENYGILCWRS